MRGGLVVAAVVLAAVSGCGPLPGSAKGKARHAILEMVFDPGAAKIAFIRQTKSAVCGTVNGKNRMGAYVGATPFVYDRQLDFLTVYGGEPETSDLRMLAITDTDDPEWKDRYLELTSKCDFPKAWKAKCESEPPVNTSNQICAALDEKDGFQKLLRPYLEDRY